MRDINILHASLAKQCHQILKRLNSSMLATESWLDGYQLSLTQLGATLLAESSPSTTSSLNHLAIEQVALFQSNQPSQVQGDSMFSCYVLLLIAMLAATK